MTNLRPRPASRDGHGIVPEKEHTTSRLLKPIEVMPSHLSLEKTEKNVAPLQVIKPSMPPKHRDPRSGP